MKLSKAIDILRLFVISPECTVIAAVMAMTLAYPAPFGMVGREVASQDYIFQYIALVPIGLLGVVFQLSKEMLRPSDDVNNRLLYEWPEYWRLKYRALGAVFYCLAASVGSLVIWILRSRIDPHIVGAGLICAMLVALAATLTQYLAYLRVREILGGEQ